MNGKTIIRRIKGGDIVLMATPFFSDLVPICLSLRREVFVEEQNVPLSEEFDKKDFDALHLMGIVNGNIVTTKRLIRHADFMQFSRFVVRRSFRGLGVGRAMFEYSIQISQENGFNNCYLEAQKDKTDLYKKFGFREFGDIFDDGGMPHIRMKNY